MSRSNSERQKKNFLLFQITNLKVVSPINSCNDFVSNNAATSFNTDKAIPECKSLVLLHTAMLGSVTD
jgi:hypothetical protein